MQILEVDLTVIVSVFNFVAGLATIWLMQCITRQADFSSVSGWLKTVQRATLALVGFTLIWHGITTLDSEASPRANDVILEIALLLPILLFAVRHIMVHQLNNELMIARAAHLYPQKAVFPIASRLIVVTVFVICLGGIALWLLLPRQPVSAYTDKELLTPVVAQGDPIRYRVTVERRRTCKGYVSDTYRSADDKLARQVSFRRPLGSTALESGRVLEIEVPAPRSLLGKVNFRSVLVSNCPEGERVDPIIEFDYEVRPE